MIVTTSKQATVARAVLTALSGEFVLRTAAAVAQESGCSVGEAVEALQSVGAVEKRRRSDGATLYGISGRVDGNDEVHVPDTVWANPAAAVPAQTAEQIAARARAAAEVEAVNEALGDDRWNSRTRTALCRIAGVSDARLSDIIEEIGAQADGRFVAR